MRLADSSRRRHGFLLLSLLAGPVISAALTIATRWGGYELPQSSLDAKALATSLLLAPVLEELVFRGGLQPLLDRTPLGRKRWGGATLGNVFTSALFSAAHLFTAPAWLAAGVFLPSLVFGRLAQLYPTLLPSILMHAWFNACYLLAAHVWH